MRLPCALISCLALLSATRLAAYACRYLEEEEDIALYARDIFSQYLKTGAKRHMGLDDGACRGAGVSVDAGTGDRGQEGEAERYLVQCCGAMPCFRA